MPVSQGKREMLGERLGQLSHLPPPSAGIASTCRVELTYSCAGGEQQGGHAAREYGTYSLEKGSQGTRISHGSSQEKDAARTGAGLPPAECKTWSHNQLRLQVFHSAK